jgi:2-polyprenyl-6-hydroxyphenyl methylase/3-demethylubiquinone-9 3-methyltransferase
VTTHPAIANYAKYPAVHWFSFYGLRDFLKPMGFHCLDRFDLIDTTGKSRLAQFIVRVLQEFFLLRLLGHVATPSTYLVAVKSVRQPGH